MKTQITQYKHEPLPLDPEVFLTPSPLSLRTQTNFLKRQPEIGLRYVRRLQFFLIFIIIIIYIFLHKNLLDNNVEAEIKAGFHMIADDRRPYCDLRSYGNQPLDRTWFYLLRSSAITIAGSQTIADLIAICDHMETSL